MGTTEHPKSSSSARNVDESNEMKRGRSGGSGERGRHAGTAGGGGGDGVLFAAVRDIDAEDFREEAKRRKRDRRLGEQSRAAQSQTSVYWSLVECRIVLQRSLVEIQKWQQQQQQAIDERRKEGEKPKPGAEIVKQCDELLTQLLEGRRLLNRGKVGKDGSGGQSDDDGSEAVDYASVLRASLRHKEVSSSPLEAVLQSEYDTIRESWKEVLNRRHKDVKLRSGQTTSKTQFKVLDSTLWQQVEDTAEHEHQHHRMRRNAASANTPSHPHDFVRPALDDSKVYQQLLKDFLSSHHGSSSSDAAHNHRGSQQQQRTSSSNKDKATVDRKASKGRKIRYHDIPKLQHFAFPISRGVGGGMNPSSTTLMDEEEWFRSLFGGVGRNSK